MSTLRLTASSTRRVTTATRRNRIKNNPNQYWKMNTTDLKVYFMNAATMAISFTTLEDTLKIVLLLVSIAYTAQRWYLMNKEKE